MITFAKTYGATDGKVRYLQVYVGTNGRDLRKFIAEKRVPPSVLKLFETTGADKLNFDDQPVRPRCIFCIGPGTRKRIFQGEFLALCEDHYYSKTLGELSAQYRLIVKERESSGILTKKSSSSRKKRKSQNGKSKSVRSDTEATRPSGEREGSEEQ